MYGTIGLAFLVCFAATEASTLKNPIETKSFFEDVPTNKVNEPTENYRLPDTAVPSNYNLKLKPYINVAGKENFTFEGEVDIRLKLTKAVSTITFHARNLTFNRESMNLFKGTDKFAPRLDFILEKQDKKMELKDFYVIKAREGNFEVADYILNIKYTGILDNDLRGFYRSSYINKDKKQVWLAATHLEPVGARRVFPCFDEPAYKATFDVTIEHDVKLYPRVIFNTKQKGKDFPVENSNWVQKVFDTTPEMSTYLLAIVVSDFDMRENKEKNFAVYARPNAIQNGGLALVTGEKILRALETYTDLKLATTKMDQAAIPDFAAGAMENWGLVLYKESALLFDENTMTTSEKQGIVEVIAHEFAHQWFGDLVSPKWWKYTWLNEGFANFFQSYITDKVEKDWRSVDQSVVKSIQNTAFISDSGLKTHPINQEVQSPDEISSIFDSISYQKGGAIIRMMQHFLTDDIFQKGLRTYLKDNSKKAATSDDLFKALQKVLINSKINVTVTMDKWVNHKGYPIVTVSRNYQDESAFVVKQERFYSYNASKEEREKDDMTPWHIPINIATAEKPEFTDTKPSHWLTTQTLQIKTPIKPEHWIILNKQQTGFYRVNYDQTNWELIINYLNSNDSQKIHILNKAQLVDDAYAFVQNGLLKLDTLMRLTATFKNEVDYVAWYPALKTFEFFNTKLRGTEFYDHFKKHVLNTTENLVNSVGFTESEKDNYVAKLNRIAALNWGCLVGNTKCLQSLQNKVEIWLNDTSKNGFSPDLKTLTLCHGLRAANNDTWKKALTVAEKQTVPNEKQQLITALGCSSNNNTLNSYLQYAVKKSSPLLKYIPAVFKSIYENNDGSGVNVILDYLNNNYIYLLETIENRNDLLQIVEGVAKKITIRAQLEKLQHLEKIGVSKEITGNALKLAENNVVWFESHLNDIKRWVEGPKKGNGAGMKTSSLGLISALLIIVFTSIQ